jgi:hypothetical protein
MRSSVLSTGRQIYSYNNRLSLKQTRLATMSAAAGETPSTAEQQTVRSLCSSCSYAPSATSRAAYRFYEPYVYTSTFEPRDQPGP